MTTITFLHVEKVGFTPDQVELIRRYVAWGGRDTLTLVGMGEARRLAESRGDESVTDDTWICVDL